jgi:hypothetical protein
VPPARRGAGQARSLPLHPGLTLGLALTLHIFLDAPAILLKNVSLSEEILQPPGFATGGGTAEGNTTALCPWQVDIPCPLICCRQSSGPGRCMGTWTLLCLLPVKVVQTMCTYEGKGRGRGYQSTAWPCTQPGVPPSHTRGAVLCLSLGFCEAGDNQSPSIEVLHEALTDSSVATGILARAHEKHTELAAGTQNMQAQGPDSLSKSPSGKVPTQRRGLGVLP